MRPRHSTAIAFASILSVAALGSTLSAQHDKGKPDPETPLASASSRAAAGMSLTAVLIDSEAKGRKNAATVKVTTRGVRIVDPALSHEKAIRGQGHIHYQVDDGPVVATTAPKLSFHGLKSGTHIIAVELAANDHTPLGPAQKLTVTIQ